MLIMNATITKKDMSGSLGFIAAGGALGIIIFFSPYMGGLLILAIIGVNLISRDPLNALAAYILIMPFTEMSIINEAFLDLPGFKPINVLALIVIIAAFAHRNRSVSIPRSAAIFTFLYLLIFTFIVLRSLHNLDMINKFDQGDLSVSRYLLSHYLKPLFYCMSFIIISLFVNNLRDVKYIMNILIISISLLSFYLLYSYLFVIGDSSDLRVVEDYYSSALGMHRNDLSTFYILCFPVLLANYYFKKSVISIMSICISIAAIGFLYSRAAYFTVILSSIIYLIVSRRTKFLPLLLVFAIAVLSVLSTSIIERASKGIGSGDLNQISSGRVDDIWLPLVSDYIRHPSKLLFGNGRYAIVSSNATIRGAVLEGIKHPHNMFLELIMDAGLLGFTIILVMLGGLMKRLRNSIYRIRYLELLEYRHAVFVSLLAYLIAGITDRSFFPYHANFFFWIIIGLSISILRIVEAPDNELTNLSDHRVF